MLAVKISTMSFNVLLFSTDVGCGLCMVIFSSLSGFQNITRDPDVLPLSDILNPNIPNSVHNSEKVKSFGKDLIRLISFSFLLIATAFRLQKYKKNDYIC